MSLTAIRIDPHPLDDTLSDPAAVGPELAHITGAWRDTPRALCWRNASSDWPLLVVLMPLATRLSLMTNPIFGKLVRHWGLGIRFYGVDAAHRLHDFRDLLEGAQLRRLVDALARVIAHRDTLDEGTAHAATTTSASEGFDRHVRSGDEALDTVFSVLASDMLTVLDQRRADWQKHLATEGRLAIDRPGADVAPGMQSLFDRRARIPEFVGALRCALREQMIDIELYGRALRSMDLREDAAETRILALLEGALDPITLAKLTRGRTGAHLGAYNWLLQDPRTAAHRASVLAKFPIIAQFVSDRFACGTDRPLRMQMQARIAEGTPTPRFTEEVTIHLLAQAIDSGQDRSVIVGLARHFGVQENTVRALWRQCPVVLGAPPEWHLRQILIALDARSERQWPDDDRGWLSLKASAVPAALGAH